MLPENVKPSTSSVASLGLGIPVGIIVVYIVNELLKVNGMSILPVEVATAVGSVVSFLVGLPFNGGRSQDTA